MSWLRRLWRRRLGKLAGGLVLYLGVRALLHTLPHAPLAARVPLSTEVVGRDGELLGMARAADGQWRVWVPLGEVSPQLVEATLLYEDRWFAWHVGVNPIALVRAAYASVTSSRLIGASTITMQVARRLDRLRTRTVGGKLWQIGEALWLDFRYSKDEILEAYLNLAPYGGNLEGAAVASRAYFGVAPSALTVEQALTLAVIPQHPSARGRTGVVSKSLDEARRFLWTQWKARHPASELDELAFAAAPALDRRPFVQRAPHLVARVLASRPAARVVTTIDGATQTAVERRLASYLQRRARDGLSNAAVIVVDRETAEVRALVGSARFFDRSIGGQVDGTRAKRSPGSTLKPFIYGLALEQGLITPETLLTDLPLRFADYAPENFDGQFAGPLSATDALVRSRNIPAIALLHRLRAPTLYDLLQRSKIRRLRSASYYGAGLALGNVELTLEELVGLYTALGHRGEWRPLRTIANDAAPRGEPILSPEASFLVLDMLGHNPRPQRLAHVPPPSDFVAWKTGTSWGFRDAWTVGVAGPYVVGVWVGNFSGRGDHAFTGLTAAAPLFFDLVEALTGGRAPRPTPPAALEETAVCALSGALPSHDCPHRKQTWFWPGHSPIAACTMHRQILVDAEGRRACAKTTGPTRALVVEEWPSDLRAHSQEVGLPRGALPPPAPECEGTELAGVAPHISSPIKSLVYAVAGDRNRIPLGAVTGADAREIFWYANRRLLGRAPAGQPLMVALEPGQYTLLAVDDLGRSDSRAVTVVASP